MNMYNNYQNKAAETAIYPGRLGIVNGGNDLKGVFYTALGLAGESGELLEKVYMLIHGGEEQFDENKNLVFYEMGDVLWYISQCCMELGVPMDYINPIEIAAVVKPNDDMEIVHTLAVFTGKYCDTVKKCMRDNHGNVSAKVKSFLLLDLRYTLCAVLSLCDYFQVPIKRIMEMNIEKLFSRKQRGQLGGSGDLR